MQYFIAMASLTFSTGPQTGEKISLERDKLTFGRSTSCDCVLAHPTISREHFSIERNGASIFLVDQASENGTFVNGERVSWIELKNGDNVQIGPFTLSFEDADSQNHADEDLSAQPALFDPSFSVELELYPPQYLEGIEHFNAGRYFDAHEIWEEIWLRSSGDTKLFYQMLIQAAVALHHHARGNARGARGMYENVVGKLERLPSIFMSLDLIDFSRQFRNFLSGLISDEDASVTSTEKPRPQIVLVADL
jgi:uncharacterized protein